jgi:hypothetical protein
MSLRLIFINNIDIFNIFMLTEKDYGRGAVLGFFHNHQLFSTAIISKLDRESDCHETVKHIVCPQNVKYRRSDGKCSNLNFPLAGAAGTPYVRLLPAVSKYDVFLRFFDSM